MPRPSALSRSSIRARTAFMALVAVGAGALALALPAMPQDIQYHDFADQRRLWGIPHALNVLSNLPFVIFGAGGVAWLLTRNGRTPGSHFLDAWEWWAQLLLLVCVTLTGFGSAYYHAHPNNDTLYWDRLPLTVVFMTFFALVVEERIKLHAGRWLLIPCIGFGVFGVTYWRWTELQGSGDMRFYALAQYFPLLAAPLLIVLFPPRYSGTTDFWIILGWYALAKFLELYDKEVYAASGAVSGHTLKHLTASMGALWFVILLRNRSPLLPTGFQSMPAVAGRDADLSV